MYGCRGCTDDFIAKEFVSLLVVAGERVWELPLGCSFTQANEAGNSRAFKGMASVQVEAKKRAMPSESRDTM